MSEQPRRVTEPKSLEALAAEWERRSEREASEARPYDGGYSDGRAQVYDTCATELREYLAARPASDLEQRLRAEVMRLQALFGPRTEEGRSNTISLLLEAAGALAAYEEYLTRTKSAHEQALIRKAENASALASRLQASLDEANARNTDLQQAYCMRISRLERELAEARSSVHPTGYDKASFEAGCAAAECDATRKEQETLEKFLEWVSALEKRAEAAEARLAERERELAEARAGWNAEHEAYELAASDAYRLKDELAESRKLLGELAEKYNALVDRATELTENQALTAPAAPHPGVGGGDDEGHVDVDIARDCLPSAAVESLPGADASIAQSTRSAGTSAVRDERVARTGGVR